LAKTIVMVRMLVEMLQSAEDSAFLFDNGVLKEGKALRKKVRKTRKGAANLLREIEKQMFYRAAIKVAMGKKRVIRNLEKKEKKYGKITEIAKLQIAQRNKD
jgi:hypothetical protein